MADVRWTLQAASDLDAIAEFIARDSGPYARLFVLDVMAAVDRLKRFPHLGRVVPELKNECVRELVLGNYRIVYRVTHRTCEILTIHHGARLLDPKRLE